jgi:hypothetical protein
MATPKQQPSKQNQKQITKRINVTEMTQSQKHELLACGLCQTGFAAFIKDKANNQIYFVFLYHDAP